MAIGFGVACPKPSRRLDDKLAARRERRSQEETFKRAVWERDRGRCRICGVRVVKTIEFDAKRGEVHHRRGRNVAPEDRFDVAQAVLLCLKCHGRAQRHEIKVPR